MKKEERLQVAMTSPALSNHSEDYPKEWEGRVPLKVYMLETVRCKAQATKDDTYYCWVNRFGAVAAILEGGKLELKPNEFRVAEWQEYLLSSVNGTALGKCKLHREEKQRRIALTSPALTKRDPETYPREWGDRVPLAVIMNVTIRSHVPGNKTVAYEEVAYYCWIDHDGEPYVITEDGKMGICSGEFRVVKWHDERKPIKGATSDVTVMDDVLPERCPQWKADTHPLAGETSDGTCKLTGGFCSVGSTKEFKWEECHRLKEYTPVNENHASRCPYFSMVDGRGACGVTGESCIVGGVEGLHWKKCEIRELRRKMPLECEETREDNSCNGMKEAKEEPGEYVNGRFEPDSERLTCPFYNVIKGRCEVAGEGYHTSGICLGIERHDRGWWEHCSHYERAQRSRSASSDTDMKLDDSKDDAGKLRKRLDILESLHASLTSNHNARLDEQKRQHGNHSGHYSKTMKDLQGRLAIVEKQLFNVTANYVKADRMSELSKQLGKYEASTIEVMKEQEDGIKQAGNHVKDNERRLDALAEINAAARLAALEGHGLDEILIRMNVQRDEIRAIRDRVAALTKAMSGYGIATYGKRIDDPHVAEKADSDADICPHFKDSVKVPSTAGKPTWQGERCPFMGKRVVNDPEIFDCLLDAGKPSPKPCPGIFCKNKAMWPTCPQLIYICPHFRPPLKGDGLEGLRGDCMCDGKECRLIFAREWQDIDGKGTNCPRMLGRVKVKKDGDEKEKA